MRPDTIDPELARQLARSPATEPLEATFTLDAGTDRSYIPSEEVEPKVQEILLAVGRQVGGDCANVTVFENLGSFAVRAHPAFLEALVKRPEIIAATANRQVQDLLIRPVRKGPKRKG